MTACRLNFLSNVNCTTNMTQVTLNNTRAPYYCLNPMTSLPCQSSTECCKPGYEFVYDVQQCLCKDFILFYAKSKLLFFL